MSRSIAHYCERGFTPLIVISALAGLFLPNLFLWIKPYIPFLLGSVMFGIGLTIQNQQLKSAIARPSVVFLALGKFITMPLLAYGISKLLHLPPHFLIGMVILGACPGGVSANVMSYFARADTALTVLLTIFTTMLSPLLTPLVIYFSLHHHVAIAWVAMMEKLFWVVLFPLLDAILVRRFLMRFVKPIEWVFPAFSILAVALIIAFVAAANRATILNHPWKILLAVLLFNLAGYVAGYVIAWIMRYPHSSRKSVAFEYGMQDSSLGIMIANQFFSSLMALPSALCSLLQNVTGPILARWWK